MKKSNIQIEIGLDQDNVPEQIEWEASDNQTQGLQKVKGMLLSLWDGKEEGTLKIDLWTKEMDVYEMKRFVIDSISGLANTVRQATSDEVFATEMEYLCQDLTRRLEREARMQQ